MIQRTHRGVSPPPSITAPLPMPRDYHDETLRLATFAQSDAMRGNRIVTPSRNQPAALPACHSPDGGLVPLLSEVAR